jgi:hypothetical protein
VIWLGLITCVNPQLDFTHVLPQLAADLAAPRPSRSAMTRLYHGHWHKFTAHLDLVPQLERSRWFVRALASAGYRCECYRTCHIRRLARAHLRFGTEPLALCTCPSPAPIPQCQTDWLRGWSSSAYRAAVRNRPSTICSAAAQYRRPLCSPRARVLAPKGSAVAPAKYDPRQGALVMLPRKSGGAYG